MKKTVLLLTLCCSAAWAGGTPDDRRLSYYFGYEAGKQLAELQQKGFSVDAEAAAQGLRDVLGGRESRVSDEKADELFGKLNERLAAQADSEAAGNAEEAQSFLTGNLSRSGVKSTASGLQYRVQKAGTGAAVRLGDEVNVSYKGRLADGTAFDENADFVFTVEKGTVIDGWVEGLQLMKKGGSYTLFVPPALGYGDQPPTADIPANAVLVFDIDVLDVKPARNSSAHGKKRRKK